MGSALRSHCLKHALCWSSSQRFFSAHHILGSPVYIPETRLSAPKLIGEADGEGQAGHVVAEDDLLRLGSIEELLHCNVSFV